MPPNFPEFEWPLHEMCFYSSLGANEKYLICARDPGDAHRYGAEIVWRKDFDTQKERDAYLARIHRLQALHAALLR